MSFDWNDIPLLLALARQGTLAATARELGINPTTVGRRLQGAEQALQARLFLRENGRYRPTSAGAVLIERAAALQGDVRGMLSAAREEDRRVAGTVRLTSVEFLIAHWLVPQLPDLRALHPGLDLQLIGDNRDLSFTRHEADLALRLARPQQDAALVMRKVGELGYAVYAAAELGVAAGASWQARCNEVSAVTRRRTSAAGHCWRSQRACQAGLGLALLPCLLGEAGGLQRCSPVLLHRELWLLCHRDLRRTLRFRALADWLAARLQADAGRLAGVSAGGARQPAGAAQ